MDAAAMVSSAAVWESVPFSTTYSTRLMSKVEVIPAVRLEGVTVRHEVDRGTLQSYALTTLEFVQVCVCVCVRVSIVDVFSIVIIYTYLFLLLLLLLF